MNSFLKEFFNVIVKVVDGFSDEGYRSFAVSLLVSTLMRSEVDAAVFPMSEVVSLVERVPKREVKALLLGECGLRFAKMGRLDEAEEAFRRALENLKEAGEEAVREVFSRVAVRVAEAAVIGRRRTLLDLIFEGLPYADAFSRAVAVGAVAVSLCALRSGELEGALNMFLEAIKMLATPSKCVRVLVEVAGYLAKMGEQGWGRELLSEALKWARRGARDERDMLLMKVARGFLRVAEATSSVEDVERAWTVASEIEDTYKRAWVENDAVTMLVRMRGDGNEKVMKARALAERIVEKTVRAWAMREIAASLLGQGLVEDAVKLLSEAAEIARGILSDKDRLPVLKDIVIDLARIGGSTGNEKFIEEALELSGEVRGDARYYSFALQKIAVEMLKAREISAEQMAKVIKVLEGAEPSFQELAMCELLELVETKGGEVDEVFDVILEWAESVKDPFYRACIKERVAEGLLNCGRVDRAAALVRKLCESADELEEPMRSSLLGGCAITLARIAAMGRREFWGEALACLRRQAEVSRRIDCTIQIVEMMFKSGESEEACKLVDDVEREVDSLEKPIPKYLLGRELALILLEAGFALKKWSLVERAVSLVRCAEGVGKKAEFLQELLEKAVENSR